MKEEDFKYVKTNRSITVHFNGDSKTAIKGDSLYDKLAEAIANKNWDEVPGLMSPDMFVASASNQQMKVEDGQVYVMTEVNGWWPVPSDFNSTIVEYMNKNIPFDRLVKFAVNLSENPSPRSVEQLFLFLSKNNFQITPEGKFVAYKSVRADFKDTYTGTFDNSPGKEVKMDRAEVNDDPTVTCHKGLHVASFLYSSTIYKGDVLLYVEVNPKDVVAVPVDYNNQKMRTCGYKVLGIVPNQISEFKSKLYDSGVTELEWSEETFDTECE